MFQSQFREAMSDAADAINATMGEYVTVTPYSAKPNFPSASDTTLPAFDIVMVFRNRASVAFDSKGSKRSSNKHDIELAQMIRTSVPTFSVKTCELPFPLRQHYRIQRCATGDLYEITDLKADGVSRIECDVVQLGRNVQLGRGGL